MQPKEPKDYYITFTLPPQRDRRRRYSADKTTTIRRKVVGSTRYLEDELRDIGEELGLRRAKLVRGPEHIANWEVYHYAGEW